MPSATPFIICPSDAPLGAEIHGVDLSQPLDEVTFRAIEDAYKQVPENLSRKGLVPIRG